MTGAGSHDSTPARSFAAEFAATADALARAAVHSGAELTGRELDVALLARAATVDLLARVHADVTGIAGRALRVDAGDVAAHPVAALGRMLRGYPRPTAGIAPSDLLDAPAPSAAGRAWQAVAVHALTADHQWASGRRPLRDGDAAWAYMVDVAAVAAVVGELDAGLAATARTLPDRAADVEVLAAASWSGLRLVAREAAELAQSGPLAQAVLDVAPRKRIPVPVRTAADLVAGQEQLAALLHTAAHLRPERLVLILSAHVRTCREFANALSTQHPARDDPSRALAKQVAGHTRLLTGAARRSTAIASIDVGDLVAFGQAARLRHALATRVPLQAVAADPALAARFAAALAATTTAACQVADRHLTGGRWLLPGTSDEGALTWVRATSWHAVPPAFQALRAAAVHAPTLTGAAHAVRSVTTPEAGPRAVPPRVALAPAPARPLRADLAPARPRHPSIPATTTAPTRHRPRH